MALTEPHQDKKTICIDYDGTYTESPELFLHFIAKAKELNYRVIICTMRYKNEADDTLKQLCKVVDEVYFSGRRAKRPFLIEQNIHPQIWIDDMPEFIIGG